MSGRYDINDRIDYFNPDYADMMAAAIKFNGNITALAEHFKVSRETMHQYMKRNPKGKEIIDQVRCFNNETMLDCAEHVMRYNLMNYKSNAGLAQRASEKVIDRLGYLRGWLPEKDAQEKSRSTEITIKVNNDGIGVGANISAEGIPEVLDKGTE